jgi:putative ABC transport system permease protein
METMTNWHDPIKAALLRHGREADGDNLAFRDVIDEWAQHAAAAFEAARAEGLSVAAARAAVIANIDAWAAGIDGPPRRMQRAAALEPPTTGAHGLGLWQDSRYAWRLLRRQPGFSLIAIGTTALAVGATTMLFSVADGVLAKPLVYPTASALVRLSETREGATRVLPSLITNVTYQTWRGSPGNPPSTIDGIAGFRASSMVVGDDANAERLRGVSATASLFDVLGVRPARGAFFTEADEAPGRPPVVVLSHAMWRTRFALSEDIVGQSIELEGRAHQIVGVLPDGITFPEPDTQFVTPFYVPPVVVTTDGSSSIALFAGLARLKPGQTPEQAAAEATSRSNTGPPPSMIDTAVFGSRGPRQVSAVSLMEFLTADVRPAILMFLGAVGLLFLTAVANISSLQLARSAARRRELAIRAAIGAGTSRLARQLLVESTLLGLAGGVAGLVLVVGLHQLLPTVLPADFPRVSDIAVDWRVMGFAMVMSLAAGMLFGLLPVWHLRRLRLVDALLEDGQAPAGLSGRTAVGRWRVGIMVAQVAAAALLLVGAGLLGRSFSALWNVDRGYDPTNVLTARVPLPDRSFAPARRADVMREVLTRVRAMPGVRDAGFSTVLPLSNMDALMGFTLPPPAGATDPVNAQAAVRSVSPGFLEAMGATMAQGRTFVDTDTLAAEQVVMVNETFTRTYLGGRGVGEELPISNNDDRNTSRVIGVVRDIQPQTRGEAPRPEVYFAAWQGTGGLEATDPMLVIRSMSEPEALVPSVRAVMQQVDPRILLDQVLTMEARLRTGLARPRLYAVLLTSLSSLALLIAGVGVFGVLSYNVAQRRREIGVRAALGAQPRDIVWLTVRQGLWITGAGLVLGLGAAALLVRYLDGLLWGVVPFDPVSFALVPVVLLVVAVLACWWPARRAASINPLTALRQ